MLPIHLLQLWFTLSDAHVEDALYESPILRQFVGIDLSPCEVRALSILRLNVSDVDLP